jgi:hypothetical protein
VVREQASSLPRGAFLLRLEPGVSDLSAARFRHHVAEALHRAGEAADRP